MSTATETLFAEARDWLRQNDPAPAGLGEQAMTCSPTAVRVRIDRVYPGGYDAFAARPDAHFEIVITSGDSAEADSPEDAVYAAQTLLREALDSGTYYGRPTASFYANGNLVRSDVSLADLSVGILQ